MTSGCGSVNAHEAAPAATAWSSGVALIRVTSGSGRANAHAADPASTAWSVAAPSPALANSRAAQSTLAWVVSTMTTCPPPELKASRHAVYSAPLNVDTGAAEKAGPVPLLLLRMRLYGSVESSRTEIRNEISVPSLALRATPSVVSATSVSCGPLSAPSEVCDVDVLRTNVADCICKVAQYASTSPVTQEGGIRRGGRRLADVPRIGALLSTGGANVSTQPGVEPVTSGSSKSPTTAASKNDTPSPEGAAVCVTSGSGAAKAQDAEPASTAWSPVTGSVSVTAGSGTANAHAAAFASTV